EKTSPLRDVAGLLRSLDYAAAFAGGSGPGDLDDAAMQRRHDVLQRFAAQSRSVFLSAYADAFPAGAALSADGAENPLLRLFVLEKAAYEICYEAANRPAWIGVPLRGLAAIADDLLGAADQTREGAPNDA
ncbi:MAG: alpha-amylase, partial [Burkholderiaceae bacterium]